jgi:signal transduction histidine kinase
VKLRIASIAILLGAVCTGLAWLPLQPLLVRLMTALRRTAPPGTLEAEALAQVRGLLPFYLGFALLGSALLCYLVLYAMLERPLRATEASVEQLGRLDLELPVDARGGPLLSRLRAALSRTADALRREQDLTRRQLAELRETNQRLTHTQSELVSAERLATAGKLAAGVAHEVGNPLSSILGYLSIARMKSRDGQVVEFLDRIDAEVNRIDKIVRGLLDLGRPSRGEVAPVDLPRLADTVVRLLRVGPDFSKVEVVLQVDAAAVALAEPGPLSQVLINLLLNAAQAMDGKGKVTLSARRGDGGRVVIVVEDSGPGISAEALPRLFEPFFTTRSGGKGTGLGLAVSRTLVQSMGGEISAENVPGGGARFTVLLSGA